MFLVPKVIAPLKFGCIWTWIWLNYNFINRLYSESIIRKNILKQDNKSEKLNYYCLLLVMKMDHYKINFADSRAHDWEPAMVYL